MGDYLLLQIPIRMNTQILTSKGFLISLATAVVGLIISNHVVAEGGVVATLLGYGLSLLGLIGGHATTAKTSALQAAKADITVQSLSK